MADIEVMTVYYKVESKTIKKKNKQKKNTASNSSKVTISLKKKTNAIPLTHMSSSCSLVLIHALQ